MNSNKDLEASSEVSAYADAFLNLYAPIRQHTHRLPHWQQGAVYYFVTWRLADSLPKEKMACWSEEENLWLQSHPQPWSSETESEYDERFSHTIDDCLDAGEGSCLLADSRLARSVANALLHYDQERYIMDSFVVMPNHVHVLFRLIAPHSLESVLKSWKGFTAREINRHLQKHGRLWQEDYWDRLIRNENHLVRCRNYIQDNPRKAHLARDKFVLFVRKTNDEFSNPPFVADDRGPEEK